MRVVETIFREVQQNESRATIMSQKYALPCNCGGTVVVELRHAGGTERCVQCAATVDVPKLRDLKKLNPILDGGATRSQGGWSGVQGAFFAVGLLTLAIATGSTYYTYQYVQSYYDGFTTPVKQNLDSEGIKNSSLVDSWRMWDELKKINLESRPQPVYVIARQRVAAMTRWLAFFGTLAAIGLAVNCVVLYRSTANDLVIGLRSQGQQLRSTPEINGETWWFP